MDSFSNLPKDIIHIILDFDGKIKYRNGLYINIIKNNDFRYTILSQLIIPRPVMYTMLYDCELPEHFESNIIFTNNKYILSVWNIYNPPNKIQYVFSNSNSNYFNVWYRV